MKFLVSFLLLFPLLVSANNYPTEWFVEIPRELAHSWEILPQDAAPGEVILSKRTELGIFSNFGATPFVLGGKSYASVEGFWQSLKYPDPEIPDDERHHYSDWPYSRSEVSQMVGLEAKDAGNLANAIYKKLGLSNINWGSHFFNYIDHASGSEFHYVLVKRAIKAKLNQNSGLWDLLMRTGCLELKSDHQMNESDPASFHYHKILMELRREKSFIPCKKK